MSNTTPVWTDGTAILAIQLLARGAVARGTIDLSDKHGARIGLFIGRLDTTGITSTAPIKVQIRRIFTTPNPDIKMPGAPDFAATSNVTAAVQGVCEDSGNPNNAGVTSLTLDAAKTFAAGQNGEIILFICDNPAAPTTASEFVRQAAATSSTVKLLDAPTISAHNNVAHTVADQADNWFPWIEGGCTYEVIFDYGAAADGGSVVIGAYAQTLDSLETA